MAGRFGLRQGRLGTDRASQYPPYSSAESIYARAYVGPNRKLLPDYFSEHHSQKFHFINSHLASHLVTLRIPVHRPHLIAFTNIRLEPDERSEDLFQRLVAFVDDNSSSMITQNITEDEEITPTLENFVVLTWLCLIHVEAFLEERFIVSMS